MQHTFHLKASKLTPGFLDGVKALFGDRDIKVVVEDIKPHETSRSELFQSTVALIDRFKDVSIDPDIDLSHLAGKVNL